MARDGERGGPDGVGVANHMTPATLPEGERALKVRVEAILTASGFIILPPGKNWKQDYLKLSSGK
jgi:hypothetical protein